MAASAVVAFILSFTGVVSSLRSDSSTLSPISGWQFFSVKFDSPESLCLIELIRHSSQPGRALLTASYGTAPVVSQNTSTGLWDVSTPYSDVEGWAHWRRENYLQIQDNQQEV